MSSTNTCSESGRYNNSSSATCEHSALENPFAEGAFRWVAKGTYTSGPRKGEACVVKWFKTGAVFTEDFFTHDIKAIDKALQIVEKFNQLGILNKTIKINVAQVWRFTEDASAEWRGQNCLVEPFIQNFEKFNSNTGWYDDSTRWGEALQSLSHFSYHNSSGQFVLCDLQGGYYQHEAILTDPVILSRNRTYGVTDLGPDGISSFFNEHVCNDFCRSQWTQPASTYQYYQPVQGTTMSRVPTAHSRPSVTRFMG